LRSAHITASLSVAIPQTTTPFSNKKLMIGDTCQYK
jgi:hypothetical protein